MRQNVNNLEHVLLGNAKPVRYIGDFHKLVFGQCAIDENSDCVAGLLRQAHLGSSGDRAAAAQKVRQLACFTVFAGVARAARLNVRFNIADRADGVHLTVPWGRNVYHRRK
jgi:hypothetical protein